MPTGKQADLDVDLSDWGVAEWGETAQEAVVLGAGIAAATSARTANAGSRVSMKAPTKLKAQKGNDIVGTKHNAIRPTQLEVHPDVVANYAQKLEAGGTVKPIDVVSTPKGNFIPDGHHRYVAGQQVGVKIPMRIRSQPGPIGLPDWSRVTYSRFLIH